MQADSVSGEVTAAFWFIGGCFLAVFPHGEGTKELSGSLS